MPRNRLPVVGARLAAALANRALSLRLFSCLVWKLDGRVVSPAGDAARVLRRDELERAAATGSMDLTSAFVDSALDLGHVCVGIVRDSQVASYCWISNAETDVINNVVLRPPSRSSYVYKAFTHPRHRGQRLLSACLHGAGALAIARRDEAVVTIVERSNLSSMRAFQAWGFRPFGFVLVGRRPPFLWHSPGCRRRGLRLISQTTHAV
jgi:hypothetical protein